jgi:hypothetical protein
MFPPHDDLDTGEHPEPIPIVARHIQSVWIVVAQMQDDGDESRVIVLGQQRQMRCN